MKRSFLGAPGMELPPIPCEPVKTSIAAMEIKLPQELDLTAARSLRNSLAEQMTNGAVVVDASTVERASTPCMQVLLAAARSADAAGVSFTITNASDAFGRALADLGLQSNFSKWMG